MLMAASDIRRMTKDADLSTHGIANDEERVRQVVAEIIALEPEPHDGVTIDPETIRTETMREGDEYHGVRCKLTADPWPSADSVRPRLLVRRPGPLDRDHARVGHRSARDQARGLSVDAQPGGEDRHRHAAARDEHARPRLRRAVGHQPPAPPRRHRTAGSRRRRRCPPRPAVLPLAKALAHMPDRQQPYAAMVGRMGYPSPPPDVGRTCSLR